MANTTARTAKHVHGTNPQFLIEKVIRARIYDSLYWKQECFALTAESLIDKAVALDAIGGTYGLQKPTPFLCLVCKLLQLQPDRQVIHEYLCFPQFKYLRAVVAMYVRLTFSSYDVYATLEPMLNDYRKLRFRQMNGQYMLTYMDAFIDELLTQDRVCELILPRLTHRDVLEETQGLAPRISKLQGALTLEELHLDKSQGSNGNDNGNGKSNENGNLSDAASDDSAQAERREFVRRTERAKRIRKQRQDEEERREALRALQASQHKDKPTAVDDDATSLDGYTSQEEDEEERGITGNIDKIDSDDDDQRFVSRSPSRSRSPSPGYQSRSPSRSPDRDAYRSRSVSRSPDRI